MDPWIALAAVAVLLFGGAAWTSRLLWRRQARESVVTLLRRRVAIGAAFMAIELVAQRLAGIDDEAFERFMNDPGTDERRALTEVATRMRIERDELASMPLSRRLVPAAEALAVAAEAVSAQWSGVGEHSSPRDTLGALERLDLTTAATALDTADAELRGLCESFGCEEVTVHGGGLYI